MAVDGVLPQFLMTKNRLRGTNTYIIASFFVLCVSQVLLMRGDVDALAGIYSISFLGVMATFTVGCILLTRSKRKTLGATLPAPAITIPILPYSHLFLALALVVLALWVNVFGKGMDTVVSFSAYFLPLYVLCLVCLYSRNDAPPRTISLQQIPSFTAMDATVVVTWWKQHYTCGLVVCMYYMISVPCLYK